MERKIKIEIWSDIVCPYCYIGFRKLRQALEKTGLTGYFEIEWHSFLLDPEYPADQAEPTTSYLSKRKGIQENQITYICDRLTQQGRNYGIDFQFDKALTFNTRKAHQLIQWSKKSGKANEMEAALFLAYFTDGVNLSKPENLVTLSESIGFDSADCWMVLKSEQFDIQIEEDRYAAMQLGVRGVPYFLLGGKIPVSGAMPDDVFENALRTAIANQPQADNS